MRTLQLLIVLLAIWTTTTGFKLPDLFSGNTFFQPSRKIGLIYATKCIPDLGCFKTGPPFHAWQRPISLVPQDRDKVNTRFLLLTRENKDKFEILKAKDKTSFANSHFNGSRKTKYIVHGWMEHGEADWIKEMMLEILKEGDYNVISVDWAGGCYTLYEQSAANTRLVGAEMALFTNFTMNEYGTKAEDFHVIGHSLGAHIGGYVGKRIRNLGRISGLDAAEPYFQNTDPKVRLDSSDALFVDVIHTDGNNASLEIVIGKGGLGIWQAIGHVDFYPNGGKYQPNCNINLIQEVISNGISQGFKQKFGCSHMRVRDLYAESINSPCQFKAWECKEEAAFNDGHCFDCSKAACGIMGYHADKAPRLERNVRMFLKTGGTKPFCNHQYKVRVDLKGGDGTRKEHGNMFVDLLDQNGQSSGNNQFFEDDIDLLPGNTYATILTSELQLNRLHQMMFRWKSNPKWYKPWELWRSPKLPVKDVEVVESNSNKNRFCQPHSMDITDDSWTELYTDGRC